MTLDERTPVLVGAGQVNQRDGCGEPIDLIAAAARNAESDAAAGGLLGALDSIRIVGMLSWRYRDPGLLVAHRLGAAPRHTAYTGFGGDTPQVLVSSAARDIVAGNADVVLVGGAEAWRTRMRLRAAGKRPEWTRQAGDVMPSEWLGSDLPKAPEDELRIGLDRPAYVYPLFEQAHRVALNRTLDEQFTISSQLWARFSEVAAANPFAWSRQSYTAAEIREPSADNRWISWPYTKLMNANNMVEQGAAVLVCSVEAARRMGVPKDNWVFVHSAAQARDTYAIAERGALHRSPAIRIAGGRALELARVRASDVALVDLYSCFPCAVQIAAAELGFPLDDPTRPLTLTGGLTFAGGPWNNYATHAIATMISEIRENPGTTGLVSANGGYLTKHAFGVYSSEPPEYGFRHEDVQDEVDAVPIVEAKSSWEGYGVLESWTVVHDREGEPDIAFLAVRTPDSGRTLAMTREPSELAAAVSEDIAGNPVSVALDGTAHIKQV